jgi:hypothetical protein
MILRPKLLRNAPMAVSSAGPVALATPVPTWLRAAAAAPQSLEDAAFAAAAALTTLDAVVRREEKGAGAPPLPVIRSPSLTDLQRPAGADQKPAFPVARPKVRITRNHTICR